MAKVIIPTPLRKFSQNKGAIETSGGTVKQAIEDITLQFPDLKKHLLDDQGKIRSFVRIFVGEDDVNALDSDQTKIFEDSVISIVPAIAGGKFYIND